MLNCFKRKINYCCSERNVPRYVNRHLRRIFSFEWEDAHQGRLGTGRSTRMLSKS